MSYLWAYHFDCQALVLISLILISFLTTTSSFPNNEMTDEVTLKAFKSKILKDPQGVFNSWNDSRHFCEWEGITCNRRHRRVTFLDFSSRSLYGTLSPYIGNLSFLRGLNLTNNSLQGQIPPEFGRLLRLEYLFLNNNSLVGELPANLSHCTRLIKVILGNNKLVGKIPPEYVSLHNLRTLILRSNNLSGGIPSFLSNLTSLESLILGKNPLGGSIPESLAQLRRLSTLGLSFDNLSGTIPLSIFNLTSLTTFQVLSNHLAGSLPPNLGLLPNLQLLHLSDNLFTGIIPVSLSNCSRLESLEMKDNKFGGKFSVDFGGMQNFNRLDISGNNLGSGEADEMKFMVSLANCTNLFLLDIEKNGFSSTLPPSIANLSTRVEEFYLSSNQFYGDIPPAITNLVCLTDLRLSDTQISGPIPQGIGNLYNLRILFLHHNQLSGEIPPSLGNLSSLLCLDLGSNKLSGVIPYNLGNLKQLIELHLDQNAISGTIPLQLFNITSLSIVLNMSHNHLVGSVPENIGNLKVLSAFDGSNNSMSGEIPEEVGHCGSLEYLYLQGNMFQGPIPRTFNSMKGIRSIDLSCNNLSGRIPKFLEGLQLEKLNLSFNHFEGEVPKKGVFANSSSISVMGNSNSLCGGIVELQLPKCLNDTSKKLKASLVFGIAIACLLLTMVVFSFAIFCWVRRRRIEQTSGSMCRKTLPKVSYEMLLKATDGFSPTHLIGRGSFGSVYKGILDQEGTVVAIKVFNLQRQGAFRSFMAECRALRSVRHRNLVKVISSCSSFDSQGNDFKAILYEFMTNGSLEKWLHHATEAEGEHLEYKRLTFLQRLNITIDVASAMEYLHNHCKEPIVHCDLKPSNVLLDSSMIAHVGDFGLVRFLTEVSNSNKSSTIGVKGSVGYAAPEYGLGSEISTRGDVYSFGILLLEILTRKKPTDLMFEGDLNLPRYARNAFPYRVMDIADPELINEELVVTGQRMRQDLDNRRKECLISMFSIGVACSLESPRDRMNITQAVNELKEVKNLLLQGERIF